MKTSVRTFISFGVATGVFGSLVLWTEWGQRTFHPDADSMGIFWLVLIGMWCIFGPLLIGCLIALTVALNRPPEFSTGEGVVLVNWGETPPAPAKWTPASILQVVVVIGFLVLNAAILIKATRNYFRKRQASDSDADDAENTENIEAGA